MIKLSILDSKSFKFDFNPWQGEKIRERKAIFLEDTNIKNMFSSWTWENRISLKTLYLFTAFLETAIVQIFWTSIEIYSIALHSSPNTVLRHYSTVPSHQILNCCRLQQPFSCRHQSGFDKPPAKPKAIWVYWVCWVSRSFQSRNPEPQDNKSSDHEFLGTNPKPIEKAVKNPTSPSFSELRNSIFISSRILETNFRNPDYTTPNRSRKRTKMKKFLSLRLKKMTCFQ